MNERRLPDAARWRGAIAVMTSLALVGCASLPSSGPTAAHIKRAVRDPNAPVLFDLVDIDPQVVQALQHPVVTPPGLAQLARTIDADVIGPGDTLNITVYEVGFSLFGGAGGARVANGAFDTSARAEKFPGVEVSAKGTIDLPYIGMLDVAGHTTADIERLIERAMMPNSQHAQALVALADNVASTVYVSGDVRKPGRFPLTPSRERLLDAIASAGGTPAGTDDFIIRFVRDGRTVEQRAGTIAPGSPDDIVLAAGDRIELIRRPRTFLVFGATNKVSQVPFDTGDVTLAEAIARVGGPNDGAADPSAIFLFRDVPQTDADARPRIYRLNMLEPASYILAQRVRLRDKDVLYIANARANQPQKLFGILNLLFSPFITARQLAR